MRNWSFHRNLPRYKHFSDAFRELQAEFEAARAELEAQDRSRDIAGLQLRITAWAFPADYEELAVAQAALERLQEEYNDVIERCVVEKCASLNLPRLPKAR